MNFKAAFFLALLAFSSVLAAEPEEKQVRSVSVECSDPQVKHDAEVFFKSALAGEFSAAAVSDAIKRFYIQQPVYGLEVFSEDAGDAVDLKVRVDIRPQITGVEIRGARSVSKKELLDRIELARGDRAIPERMEKARLKVKAYYAYRGFPRARVNVELRRKSDPREGTLRIDIAEAEPCRISSVAIDLPPGRIQTPYIAGLLKVSPGDRCDGRKVADGAKRIEDNLHAEGYLSAHLADPELVHSEDLSAARLSLRVIPGPRILVRFIGNTFAFERNGLLERAVLLEDERQFNQGWIESTAKEGIRQFYRERGYPEAEVRVTDEYREKERLIQFTIRRGPKIRIGKVEFRGARKIPARELENQFWGAAPAKTRNRIFVRDEFMPIIDALLAYYQGKGFLRIHIPPPGVTMRPRENKADLVFHVEEGGQSTVASYNITGNHLFDDGKIKEMISLQEGAPLDPVSLRASAEKIAETYRAAGYKFARVDLPRVEEIPEGPVAYDVKIEEGAMVRIGSVSVRGNLHTEDYVILRELSFEEGERYDPEKIKNSRRKLLRLGFFESVSIEELPPDPATSREDVVISVMERKKRSVAFRPGYSTDDGARAAVELGYANIAGTGRSATLYTRISRQFHDADILEHREVFTYLEPRIFNIVDGKVNFINERSEQKQFNLDQRSVILGLDKNILNWVRTTLQWELEYRDPFDVQPGVVLSPFDQAGARFGSLSAIVDFDRRNDPLNATRGTFHRLEFRLFDRSFLSDADFMQAFVRNSFYIPIYKRIRSVLSVRAGFSATYGKTKRDGISEIPIEKRFRLGGNDSLRGFNRNCIGGLPSDAPENCSDATLSQAPGGNSMFNYMFDLLFPLFDGFDLALFTDGGNAYLTNSDFSFTNIRNTVGAGIRYNTFFGPLRLDYGIVLDRRTGENFGEIHFAVGQF